MPPIGNCLIEIHAFVLQLYKLFSCHKCIETQPVNVCFVQSRRETTTIFTFSGEKNIIDFRRLSSNVLFKAFLTMRLRISYLIK